MYNELKNFIENNTIGEILNNGNKLLLLISYYRRVFGEKCSFCKKDHITYFNRLKNEGINIMYQIENGLFMLKGILTFTGGEMYSNSNITDEIAIKILKKNKVYINKFSKFPENWEELITEPTTTEFIEAGNTSKGNILYYVKNEKGKIKKVLLNTAIENNYTAVSVDELEK